MKALLLTLLTLSLLSQTYSVVIVLPSWKSFSRKDASSSNSLENTCRCDCCYSIGHQGRTECIPAIDTSFDTPTCTECSVDACAAAFPVSCAQPSSIVTSDCIKRNGWMLRLVPVLFLAVSISLLFYACFIKKYDGYHDDRVTADLPTNPLLAAINPRYDTFRNPNFTELDGVTPRSTSTLPPIAEHSEVASDPDPAHALASASLQRVVDAVHPRSDLPHDNQFANGPVPVLYGEQQQTDVEKPFPEDSEVATGAQRIDADQIGLDRIDGAAVRGVELTLNTSESAVEDSVLIEAQERLRVVEATMAAGVSAGVAMGATSKLPGDSEDEEEDENISSSQVEEVVTASDLEKRHASEENGESEPTVASYAIDSPPEDMEESEAPLDESVDGIEIATTTVDEETGFVTCAIERVSASKQQVEQPPQDFEETKEMAQEELAQEEVEQGELVQEKAVQEELGQEEIKEEETVQEEINTLHSSHDPETAEDMSNVHKSEAGEGMDMPSTVEGSAVVEVKPAVSEVHLEQVMPTSNEDSQKHVEDVQEENSTSFIEESDSLPAEAATTGVEEDVLHDVEKASHEADASVQTTTSTAEGEEMKTFTETEQTFDENESTKQIGEESAAVESNGLSDPTRAEEADVDENSVAKVADNVEPSEEVEEKVVEEEPAESATIGETGESTGEQEAVEAPIVEEGDNNVVAQEVHEGCEVKERPEDSSTQGVDGSIAVQDTTEEVIAEHAVEGVATDSLEEVVEKAAEEEIAEIGAEVATATGVTNVEAENEGTVTDAEPVVHDEQEGGMEAGGLGELAEEIKAGMEAKLSALSQPKQEADTKVSPDNAEEEKLGGEDMEAGLEDVELLYAEDGTDLKDEDVLKEGDLDWVDAATGTTQDNANDATTLVEDISHELDDSSNANAQR